MTRITEEASATISMNMEPARKELEKWAKVVEDGKKELEELLALPEEKRDYAAIRKLEATIAKATEKTKEAEDRLKTYRDTMNNLSSAPFNDLYKASKQLESQIKRLKPGTEEYIAATHDLQMVNTRINDLKKAWKAVSDETDEAVEKTKGFKATMDNISKSFQKYWSMFDVAMRTITGISMKFRQCAEDAAKLDDVYADVMKTTGLLHEEVAALDKELMKIDTRTSREQLLLLARDAGKLGIQGRENILGFVRAADQIQVALGEDLGEGAIKNLGKIADVFGLTDTMGIEKSLLSIASAVNALGQASTASEAYLVEFTQRLAGVGAMAGLSVQDILGYASGLDQSAMKVEMAATAFQKFLMKMYEDTATFAGYAGMQVEEFSELLKNDANTAIVTVMKAMNGQDGFASLVPMFNEMNLDGARAVTVLASMAQNLEAVSEAQALANEEFAKGTSVTEEYNTKNNNLQAQLEKARKEFHNASIALGQSLNPVLLKSTKLATYLIKLLATHGKELRNAAIAVAALTAVIKANTIAETVANTAKKVWNTLTQTGTFLTSKMTAAYYKLTGQTLKYAAAQRAANAAASKSVFGVILMVVGLLVYKLTEYIEKQREAAEAAKELEVEEGKLSGQYVEQETKVRTLSRILEDNTQKLSDRKKALEELRSIVPFYHAELTEEGKLINNNKIALEEYNKLLRVKARLENSQVEIREREGKMQDLEEQMEDYDLLIAAAQKEEESLRHLKVEYDAYMAEYRRQLTTPGEKVDRKYQNDRSVYNNAPNIAPYNNALGKLNELKGKRRKLQDEWDALDAEQEKELERIGVYTNQVNSNLGSAAGAMEREMAEVTLKYEEMFKKIREESIGNPEEGEEKIRLLTIDRDKEIEEIRNAYAKAAEELDTRNKILNQTQFDYLKTRYDKLTKKEKEMIDRGYASLSNDELNALKARYNKIIASEQNLLDKRYQQELKALQQKQRSEQNDVNRLFFEGEITAEQHEERLREIKMESLQAQLELAEKYGQDTTHIEASILTEQTNARKARYDKELKDVKACYAEEENALKLSLAAGEITQKEYDSRMLELKMQSIQERLELAAQYGQDETAILQEMLDTQFEAQKAANEEMKKLKEEAKKVIEGQRSPSEARDAEMQAQLARLDVLHEAMLLSEQQYEEAVRQLRKKYADEDLKEKLANVQKYVEQVNNIMSEASNFVSALKEAETAKLEAEYQAQLTAAGDNAERREEIEAEYEQKQLELKKQYADTEMAINIAKTIASGAVAAIKAYAEGGPYLGIALAALIAATTAAEVATIIAQRNAIKNTTVSSSTSGSASVSPTVVTPTGYSGGGFTDSASSDSKPVGIVHANEWVAPAPMVRRHPVLFANLEKYRKMGFPGARQGNGFASGGFTGSGSAASDETTKVMLAAIQRLESTTAANAAAINRLVDEGVQAYEVYNQRQSFETQRRRFKKATSR